MLINLGNGDDQLLVLGADWDLTGSPPPSLDDLIINTGNSDSITQIANLHLWDTLTFRSGNGEDTLGIFGKSHFFGLQVSTRGGPDFVQFGNPGASVFADEPPGDIFIRGDNPVNQNGVQRRLNWLDTGPGNDTVLVSGGRYENFAILLGSGSDSIRFESAVASGIELRPGAMNDLIAVIDSNLYMSVFQDATDVFRFHRVWKTDAHEVGSGGNIRLQGRDGVRVQIPESGLQVRDEDESRTLSANQGSAAWVFNHSGRGDPIGLSVVEALPDAAF